MFWFWEKIKNVRQTTKKYNGEKCDFCGNKTNEMGANCEKCKFNFCGNCYYNFTNMEPNKFHKHPLTLIKRHSDSVM